MCKHSISICSNSEQIHVETDTLSDIFKKNSYLSSLIDRCISVVLQKLYVPKKVHATVSNKKRWIVLPFLGKFSMNFERQLISFFLEKLCHNVKLISSLNLIIACILFSFRDIISNNLCINLVCKFFYGGCNVTYYDKIST